MLHTFNVFMLEEESQNPGEFKDVEMVESMDELKSSRSIESKDFTNFEMLDARLASDLKIISEFSLQKEGQSGGTESSGRISVSSRKTDRIHDLRLLSSYRLVLMIPFLIMRICSLSVFETMMFRNLIRDGMKFC